MNGANTRSNADWAGPIKYDVLIYLLTFKYFHGFIEFISRNFIWHVICKVSAITRYQCQANENAYHCSCVNKTETFQVSSKPYTKCHAQIKKPSFTDISTRKTLHTLSILHRTDIQLWRKITINLLSPTWTRHHAKHTKRQLQSIPLCFILNTCILSPLHTFM